MKILNICNKIIEYSFYLLFFLVPLALTGDTSELFEFNKLWVAFIITIVIGVAWFSKMIITKEVRIQRTPLDIPIGLFLISEIISTFLSLDPHTSIWGYYSRFNGGLLSIFSFVFLYYAFVSNLLVDENKTQESKAYDYVKSAFAFAGGIGVFILGALIATALKPTVEAGIPFQLLTILSTTLISFALFMLARPAGIIKRSLYSIFVSALIVILWGLPSHFGFDPTCLLFRGTFDVSCWTTDFHPTLRIFSTLGQPDWMAAYIGILIPILTALFLNYIKDKDIFNRRRISSTETLLSVGFFVFYIAMYAAFMYTRSRAAIIALWFSLFFFFVFYFWYYIRPKLVNKTKPVGLYVATILIAIMALLTFFIGLPGGFPFNRLSKFTWDNISQSFSKPAVTATTSKPTAVPTPTPQAPFSTGELGGTDSTKIRAYVWQGAIDIWAHNPIFGTGVETFAFAYYQYRPAGHNMTSEWQYLYNKAHNEFLNYLATTGSVGIITYLLMIGGFYYITGRYLYRRRNNFGSKELLIFSFMMGYTVINITNFGGFSVVIVNIFFYLFPALVFYLAGLINFEKTFSYSFAKDQGLYFGNGQKILSGIVIIIGLYLIYTLVNFWNADRYYYYGYNYDRTGDYQKAYTFLKTAVSQRSSEPTFQDEFAYNQAILGAAILAQSQAQKDQSQQQNIQIGQSLINSAVNLENQVTSEHSNNVVFWKTKVRIYYTLAQIDSSYYPMALQAIQKAASLAPTDADVSYNLGVLYGQNGDFQNAVQTLQNTIKLKPDYKGGQAFYALAVFYHQLAIDKNGKIVNSSYNQKAIDELKLMEQYFGQSQQASDALKAWQK